jgi:glutathione S-transferase
MPKAHIVFNELSRLLGDQPYFAGDKISLADLHIVPQFDFLSQTPEWTSLTASNPNLVAWLSRLNERASVKATTWDRVAELAKAA